MEVTIPIACFNVMFTGFRNRVAFPPVAHYFKSLVLLSTPSCGAGCGLVARA